MPKVSNISISVRNGGFIVGVTLEEKNIDANPDDNTYDEYVVTSYAKLMKALKAELSDFRPAVKPRVAKVA